MGTETVNSLGCLGVVISVVAKSGRIRIPDTPIVEMDKACTALLPKSIYVFNNSDDTERSVTVENLVQILRVKGVGFAIDNSKVFRTQHQSDVFRRAISATEKVINVFTPWVSSINSKGPFHHNIPCRSLAPINDIGCSFDFFTGVETSTFHFNRYVSAELAFGAIARDLIGFPGAQSRLTHRGNRLCCDVELVRLPFRLLDCVPPSFSGCKPGYFQRSVISVGATLGLMGGNSGKESRKGRGSECEKSEDRLSSGRPSLPEQDLKVPLGHIVRTCRLSELLLLCAMIFGGLAAAVGFVQASRARKFSDLAWIAFEAAGLVVGIGAIGALISRYVWVPW